MTESSSSGALGGRDVGAERASVDDWTAMLLELPREILRRVRRTLVVLGILALIAGVAAIAVPIAATVTMTIFIGWILMFFGVVSLFHAFSPGTPAMKTLRMLNAVLAILVGLYLVVLPLTGSITLTFLLAVWFFGTGVLMTANAVRHRGQPGWGWTLANGVISIILGVMLVADLPSTSAWAIGLLVGINLLFWGARALATAGVLRAVEKEAEEPARRPAPRATQRAAMI
jgi:uncharacterized membrane protein HdeD (DUF308 family)